MTDVVEGLDGGLIVSCQAPPGSPLDRPDILAAIAKAAQLAGAVAIRADGARNIEAIKRECELPIIGIKKVQRNQEGVYITPSLADALEVIEAGAEIVAVDATLRRRPDGTTAAALVQQLKRRGIAVMADIDDLVAAKAAADAGAELIATTLSGYVGTLPTTRETPDLGLVAEIAATISGARVVAEGRYSTPADVTAALAKGAFAVVVGTAITNPLTLARKFVQAAREAPPHSACAAAPNDRQE